MAKYIKYRFLSAEINHGTEEAPDIEQVFLTKSLRCKSESEYNEALLVAEKEAYNGTYEVIDDGTEEAAIPTIEDRTEALESALLEMMGVTVGG